MELTGKCKEVFNDWLEMEHDSKRISFPLGDYLLPCYHDMNFYSLPNSMQYGVYVDFFDSCDMIISIDSVYVGDPMHEKVCVYEYEVCVNDDIFEQHNTRHEARTKAIEKANEQFNSKS